MPGNIFVPRYQNQMMQLLGQVALMQIQNNMRLKEAETEAKYNAALQKEEIKHRERIETQKAADKADAERRKQPTLYKGEKYYWRWNPQTMRMEKTEVPTPPPKSAPVKTVTTKEGVFSLTPEGGRGERLGSPVVSQPQAPQTRFQRKKRTYIDQQSGKTMVQEYDFDPRTRKETTAGQPYEIPKSTSLWDILNSSGSGGQSTVETTPQSSNQPQQPQQPGGEFVTRAPVTTSGIVPSGKKAAGPVTITKKIYQGPGEYWDGAKWVTVNNEDDFNRIVNKVE